MRAASLFLGPKRGKRFRVWVKYTPFAGKIQSRRSKGKKWAAVTVAAYGVYGECGVGRMPPQDWHMSTVRSGILPTLRACPGRWFFFGFPALGRAAGFRRHCDFAACATADGSRMNANGVANPPGQARGPAPTRQWWKSPRHDRRARNGL